MLLLLFLLLFYLNLPPLTDQMPQTGNETKNATKAAPAAKLPPMNGNGTLNLLWENQHDLHEMHYALKGIVDLIDDDDDTDEAMTKAEVDQYMIKLERELQQGRHKGRGTSSLLTDEAVVLLDPVSLLVTLGGLILKAALSYGLNQALGAAFAPSASDPLPNGIGRVCGEVSSGSIYQKECSQTAGKEFKYHHDDNNKLYLTISVDGKAICAKVIHWPGSNWFERNFGIYLTHHVVSVCTRKQDGKKCVYLPEPHKYHWGKKLCVITETWLTQWCREARENKQQARKNIKDGLYKLIEIGDKNGDGKLTHDEAYDILTNIAKKKKLEYNLEYIMCGLEGLGYYKAQLPKLGAANSTMKKP